MAIVKAENARKDIPLVSIIAVCYNHSKYVEETLDSMDNGMLPKHVHPNIPEEMMETLEEITETAPALKLWPLAVLVFYSEFIIYIVFDV